MRAALRLLSVVTLAFLGLATACATGQTHTRATRPVRELPKGYDVSAIQEPRYPGEGGVQTTPEALIALARETLPQPGGAIPEHDPALDDVAAVIATTLAETEQLPVANLTRWLLWHAGVPGAPVATYGTHGSTWVEAAVFDEHLKGRAASVDAPVSGKRRFGVARVVVGERVGQALLVVDTVVELDPLEKTTSAGQTVALSGRFHVPVERMRLFVDDAPTKVRTLEVKVAADGRFTISFPAPETPGAHYLELAGFFGEDEDARRWSRQALLFPIYVDAPLPTEPDDEIRAPASNPEEVAAFADAVLARYNAARAEEGIAPLVHDPRLAALALRLAEESRGQERHQTDDRLERVLASAGLTVRRTEQIATRFEYLEEDVWEMLRSPGMRAVLLDPRLTHVGLGYAAEEEPGRFVGRALLVMPVGKLDPERERQALLQGLNRLVERREKRTLEVDDTLTRLTQAFAERVCRGEIDVADTGDLQRAVEKYAQGRYQTYSLFPTGGPYVDPNDRRNFERLLERPASHVGVGVCQGKVQGQDGTELVIFLTAR